MVTSYPDLTTPDEFSFYDPRLENMTVDMLLSDDLFLETCRYAQGYVDYNLELLLDEIPLSRDDVLRIPTLFQDVTFDAWPPMLDGLPPRLHRAPKGERQLIALLPSAINGVVIGSDYLAAKPWGPVVEGRDIFEELVRDVYGKANMTVHFVDDFMSHHVNGGEVHCGTNTLRDTEVAWWK
jgi:protein-arginine deiminase